MHITLSQSVLPVLFNSMWHFRVKIVPQPIVSLLEYLYLLCHESPTALLDIHLLTCGISSLLHSVNLILFTLLLAHLILRISPHHSHHICSHHLSLPRPVTLDLDIIFIMKSNPKNAKKCKNYMLNKGKNATDHHHVHKQSLNTLTYRQRSCPDETPQIWWTTIPIPTKSAPVLRLWQY